MLFVFAVILVAFLTGLGFTVWLERREKRLQAEDDEKL